MTGSTLYHIHFIESGQDHYFGSIAAIYDTFDRKVIGVSQSRLYDYGITPDHPYKNKKVTIKKGENKRKRGGRRKTIPAPRIKILNVRK